MADPGYNIAHTHTTTVQTSNTVVETSLRFDPSYIRTLPGMLKIAQVVLNLLGFICVECGQTYAGEASRGAFFEFVSMAGFWFTALLLALYLFHFIEKFYKMPWLKIELVACGIFGLFYLIAASLVISLYDDAYIAAGFFGFCAMVAYAFDAFLKFKAIKSGQLAQGERVISKETTTTFNTPAY